MKMLFQTVFALAVLSLLSGCHFVGDPEASLGEPGFFAGLWDAAVLLWSVVLTCFTQIQIVDPQGISFAYKFGFAVGIFMFTWNIGIFFGAISFFLYLLPM